MYSEISQANGQKYINLIWLTSSWYVVECSKKTKVELELLTDLDMLLLAKKEISGAVCLAIHRYA